ncbi:MAG: DNA repair protein RecO [Defluviitaleaceae bacterium]|nr:DNA repair protein RecO [Defluviitaleaceae bacterium]
MKTIKVRGLVLKEYEAGEADKRLLLLCKGEGRLMVYARGARKPRSRFLAASQIFTYSDFILAQGKGFYSLTQADLLENFYNLRTDYDTLCAAHSIVEVCEKTLWEKSDCDKLLLLVLKSLSLLSKGRLSPQQIKIVFLTRFFDFYGLRPHVNGCFVCGLPLREMGERVFWGAEGVACSAHASMPISQAAAAAFGHMLDSELSQAFQFMVHENVLGELQNAVQFFWKCHFDVV